MKNIIIKSLLFGLLFTFTVRAEGVSPYLPLKTDPMFELEVERLATITKMPVLNKPFHVKTVYRYLEKIEFSYPVLHSRIKKYIKRFKKTANITHFSVKALNDFDSSKSIANARGQDTSALYQGAINGYWQMNKYFITNIGGSYYEDGDFVPSGSYLSFGVDWLQVDLGFREHWLSPHQESSLLLSTNASPAINVTFSNVTPLTDWSFRYEMSVGLLDEHQDIEFDGTSSAGEPGFLSMHFSAQPIDWWTIGLNRTFMFAGGDRSIGFNDIWDAIIDPVNSDNCAQEATDCDKNSEVGNQIASITNRFDLILYNTPFSIYYEYAGEDTKAHSNYQLGNVAQSFGLFLPYITNKSSLNLELTDFSTHWYVHHIYGNGYSNKNNVMGHWWGNSKHPDERSGGKALSLRFNWENSNNSLVSILYRTADINQDESDEFDPILDYEQSHEIQVTINQEYNKSFLGLSFYAGKDTLGDNFFQTSLSYHW